MEGVCGLEHDVEVGLSADEQLSFGGIGMGSGDRVDGGAGLEVEEEHLGRLVKRPTGWAIGGEIEDTETNGIKPWVSSGEQAAVDMAIGIVARSAGVLAEHKTLRAGQGTGGKREARSEILLFHETDFGLSWAGDGFDPESEGGTGDGVAGSGAAVDGCGRECCERDGTLEARLGCGGFLRSEEDVIA